MRPTEELRQANDADWQAIAGHPFCRDLAVLRLPDPKMAAYLVQDHHFVEDFARLLASAIAHAPTIDDMVPAAQFIAVITGPENTYFRRAFGALGVPLEAHEEEPEPETRAFQDLMEEARQSGSYARMLAVLTVAEWSYLSWAAPFHPASDQLPFWFAEWIKLHAGEDFEGVVEYLRGQLDTQWATLDQDERDAVADLFTRAVKLERAFFDAAYDRWTLTVEVA